MKLVVSSYKTEDSICLYEIKGKEVIKHDSLDYYEPSFVIYNKEYVITYSKEPITLRLLKIKNDKFDLIDSYLLPLPFTTLTHLCFNKDNNKLYACSYKDGSYLSIDINNGKFENIKYFKKEKPLNGISPCCHQVVINYDTKEVYIVDIKNDCIDRFNYNLDYLGKFDLPSKVGPRHAVYDSNYLYVVTEYSNEVYKIDTLVNKVVACNKTIIKDVTSYGATVFIHDNKLYASNRGEETIAYFDLNDLTYLGNMSVYGANSRHMINFEDKIISLNKDSNNVCIINIFTKEKELEFSFEKAACACVIK